MHQVDRITGKSDQDCIFVTRIGIWFIAQYRGVTAERQSLDCAVFAVKQAARPMEHERRVDSAPVVLQ